jgi:outer membrane protein
MLTKSTACSMPGEGMGIERNLHMTRISLWISVFIGTMIILFSGVSQAADVKIGMIDTQKIMREAKAAKKARDVLMKDLEAKRAKYKAEEDEARKLEEELKKGGQSMAPAARQEKADKLEKEIKELGRLKSDLEEDFRKKDAELTRKLLKEIYDIVKEYRKKEKFTVILERRYVVTADDAIDITDKIIKLYDAVK